MKILVKIFIYQKALLKIFVINNNIIKKDLEVKETKFTN